MTGSSDMATVHDFTRRAARPTPGEALAEDVRWFTGSLIAGLFGRLAFDQVAYREIAASVDRTGRFARNFTDRGVRSFAHVELMTFGDRADIQEEIESLKQKHRAVRGTGKDGFADTRYSALSPDTWKWVAVSGINAIYQAYVHTAGRTLDPDEHEIVYQTIRVAIEPLELPGQATKLPATLIEMNEYYDGVARTKLADNEFLRFADRHFGELPLPALIVPAALRPLLQPIWQLVLPFATRPPLICAAGAAHPRMRELLGPPQRPWHRYEFALYTGLAGLAWRHLPRRLTLSPMAYNRFRYEKLRDLYRSIQLESFAAS
ncbi:oxygenase MpaB family protein [Nocardia sp. NPDC051030]|uniref:oxygenase MpaB family protein n=1 Tax=Nocardia sp. NPDC051030 TaxID=3155162 RepID=UPI003438F186